MIIVSVPNEDANPHTIIDGKKYEYISVWSMKETGRTPDIRDADDPGVEHLI